MVKRFENDYGDIRESLDGPFVMYEDYERMKADRDYWYSKCLDAGLLDEESEENKNDNP